MKPNLLLLRTLAVFLILALGLPAAVHPEPVEGYTLRQSGLEEGNAKKDFLDQIGYSAPTAGVEEKFQAPTEALTYLLIHPPPGTFYDAMANFGSSGRLVDGQGAPLSIKSREPVS